MLLSLFSAGYSLASAYAAASATFYERVLNGGLQLQLGPAVHSKGVVSDHQARVSHGTGLLHEMY